MPKSYTNAEREHRTYHAPWWSAAKDAQGVWLERVELWYPQTERDSQWITDAVQKAQRAEQKGKGGGGSNRQAVMDASLGGLKNTRMFTLMRMVTALTDETGRSVLPPPSASDTDKMDFWRGLPDRDAAFIAEQIEEENSASVPVLPEDEEEAEAKGSDAEVVAENHFRQIGAVGAAE